MVKKKKKTIKVEIPVPDMPSASKISKTVKESVDAEKVHETIKKNIPKEEIEKTRVFLEKNYKPVSVVVVAVIAIIVVSFSLPPQSPQIDQTLVGPQYQKIMVDVPAAISFSDYLENYQNYADQEVSILGFLLNRLEQAGGTGSLSVYAYYMIDDFDSEIHLTGLDTGEKAKFVRDGITEDLYDVKGIIKTKYAGFDLEVTSITPAERPMTQVEKTVPVS
jgi:hypothetical protein